MMDARSVLLQIQSNHGIPGILKVVEQLCDPQEYFSEPDEHRKILTQINNVLRFFGFLVKENGKIISTQQAETFPIENTVSHRVSQQKVNVLAVFANPRATTPTAWNRGPNYSRSYSA